MFKDFFLKQPSQKFFRDPLFHVKYDLGWAALLVGVISALILGGYQAPTEFFQNNWLWIFLLASYASVLCTVFVHNAAHRNWPKWLNRIVGEVTGFVVLTRYASWEIVHHRHHRYSDHPVKDPHPVQNNFWKFCFHIFQNIELQMQNYFFDYHGDTPQHRRLQTQRAWLSFGVFVLGWFFWYVLLGGWAFVALFLPVNLVMYLHLMHFNYATHGAPNKDAEEFAPVDRDDGILWWGNRLLFGIYAHRTHHENVNYFNPFLHAPRPMRTAVEPGPHTLFKPVPKKVRNPLKEKKSPIPPNAEKPAQVEDPSRQVEI